MSEVMIFAHTVESQEKLNYIKNHENISPNPEHYARCVARERCQEIEHYEKTNQIIFWNPNTRQFTETDFSPVVRDLKNEIIFARPSVEEFKNITEDILKRGWTPLTQPHEHYVIENWMYIVPHEYLKRKIILSTKQSVSQNFDLYHEGVKDERGRFFIKSVKKDWSYDGSPEGWFDTGMFLSLEAGSSNDRVMLSEWLDIAEDDNGGIEYRSFVLGGELKSMSRYLDYTHVPHPKEAEEYVEHLINELVGKYIPKNVVIDIAQLKSGEWTLIEINDPTCSGRYVGNSVLSIGH